MGMDQYLLIPFFSGMNIHLPAILMFTRGTRFWHTAIYFKGCEFIKAIHHISIDTQWYRSVFRSLPAAWVNLWQFNVFFPKMGSVYSVFSTIQQSNFLHLFGGMLGYDDIWYVIYYIYIYLHRERERGIDRLDWIWLDWIRPDRIRLD